MTEEQIEPTNEMNDEPISSSRQFENEENKAIPGKVKLLGLGIVVVLLAAIYSIFSGSDKTRAIPKSSFASSTAIGKKVTNAEETKSDTKVEINDASDHKIENKGNTEDVFPIHPVSRSESQQNKTHLANEIGKKHRLSGFNNNHPPQFNKKLALLEERVEKTITENTALKEHLEELINKLQEQLASQEIKIEQIQKNYLATSKEAVSKKTNKKALRTYRKKERHVPLTLVSIDQWGADTYAVVRDEKMKMLHELTVDESILGWRVISINRNRRLIVLVNERGINKELFIKS